MRKKKTEITRGELRPPRVEETRIGRLAAPSSLNEETRIGRLAAPSSLNEETRIRRLAAPSSLNEETRIRRLAAPSSLNEETRIGRLAAPSSLFNPSLATGSPTREARHAEKICVCERCGAPRFQDCTYCSRSCYLEAAQVSKRECPICKKSFKPSRHNRVYCSKKCYGKSLLHTPANCVRCGRSFIAVGVDQAYCSAACQAKPRELTWADITKPTKPTWREVPRSKWQPSHFWYWICDSLAYCGYVADRRLSAKSWAILRNFLKSRDMAEIISVMEGFIAEYLLYVREFKWAEKNVFTSRQLIGYWASIKGIRASSPIQDWSTISGWEPLRQGDTCDSPWGPPLQRDMSKFDSSWGPPLQRDMSTFDSSWGPEPEDTRVYDSSWEPSEQSVKREKAAKPKGRILLKDWKTRLEADWVVPTLWGLVTDKLLLAGHTVRPLTPSDRKKLEAFVAKESMPVVIAITRELLDGYYGYTAHLHWHGDLTASIFIGYWGAFKKAVKKRFPGIEEVVRDS